MGSKGAHTYSSDWLPFVIIIIVIQIVCVPIYATLFEYPDHVSGAKAAEDAEIWPLVLNVSIMIFVGFGYLMTFLRKYGYSAVGYTTLISCLVMEIGLPIRCMYGIDWVSAGESHDSNTTTALNSSSSEIMFSEGFCEVGVYAILDALFCAGAVMISFGALLGRTNTLQLTILGIVETFAFFGNVKISLMWDKFGVHDIGGGLTIHTLGAYTGLVTSCWLGKKREADHPDNKSNYTSDLFSFIGTLFLFVMWPSFNAVLADRTDGSYARALVNTFISLIGCTLATFVVSRTVDQGRRIAAVHFANSILAGGVVMGVAADLDITWAGALSAGLGVGIISVLGFSFLTPRLNNLGMVDVCGIHNLHGMPGVLSAIVGIGTLGHHPPVTDEDPTATTMKAAQYETAFLAVTLAIAFLTGTVAGGLLKLVQRYFPLKELFDDEEEWEMPAEGVARIPPIDLHLRDWLDKSDLKDTDKQILQEKLAVHHMDIDTLSGATAEELDELGLPVGVKRRLVNQLSQSFASNPNVPRTAASMADHRSSGDNTKRRKKVEERPASDDEGVKRNSKGKKAAERRTSGAVGQSTKKKVKEVEMEEREEKPKKGKKAKRSTSSSSGESPSSSESS